MPKTYVELKSHIAKMKLSQLRSVAKDLGLSVSQSQTKKSIAHSVANVVNEAVYNAHGNAMARAAGASFTNSGKVKKISPSIEKDALKKVSGAIARVEKGKPTRKKGSSRKVKSSSPKAGKSVAMSAKKASSKGAKVAAKTADLTSTQAKRAQQKIQERFLRHRAEIDRAVARYRSSGVDAKTISDYKKAASASAEMKFKRATRSVMKSEDRRIASDVTKKASSKVSKTAAKTGTKVASRSLWGSLKLGGKIAGRIASKFAGPVGLALTAYDVGSGVNSAYKDVQKMKSLDAAGQAKWHKDKRTAIAGGSLQQKFSALSPAQKAKFKTLDKAGRKAMLTGGGKSQGGAYLNKSAAAKAKTAPKAKAATPAQKGRRSAAAPGKNGMSSYTKKDGSTVQVTAKQAASYRQRRR